MKAILIDVTNRSVTEVQIGDDWREISRTIGCDMFTTVRLTDTETLFVDDEGLFTDKDFFHLNGYPQPLAGNGLILGTSLSGESVDTKLFADVVASHISFSSKKESHVEPKIEITSW